MTSSPAGQRAGRDLVQAFPRPGPRVVLAYRELSLAANRPAQQISALGDPDLLPRPWDPATCTDAKLRAEVWEWLEDVTLWLNHEYVWDVATMVPSCWPHHPHLVHEIAVLADQRHRAGTALTSDALATWHEVYLPLFVDRMRTRTKDHCEERHQPWPARGRHARTTSAPEQHDRHATYAADVTTAHEHQAKSATPGWRLGIVNIDTGEITDPH